MKGFTLWELLISILIIAILSSIAIPGLSALNEKYKSQSRQNLLIESLKLAKEHAIFSGNFVISCHSADAIYCDNKSNNFLISFEDLNKNYLREENEEILHTVRTQHAEGTNSWNNIRPLRFRPDGSVSFPGSFIYCPNNNDQYAIKRVTINRSGRVYFARPNKSGFVRSASGKKITCS